MDHDSIERIPTHMAALKVLPHACAPGKFVTSKGPEIPTVLGLKIRLPETHRLIWLIQDYGRITSMPLDFGQSTEPCKY
jgi:hypothetical protein